MAAISFVSSSEGNAPLDVESKLAFAIASCTVFALVLWEFITILPHEIRLYRKAVWATVPPYAFILLRYGSVLATLPTVFLSSTMLSTTAMSCQAAASLSQAGFILVVISTAIIFTFRTAQLWANNDTYKHEPLRKRRNMVLAALGVLVIVALGCCIAPAAQYRATLAASPTTVVFSNCDILPLPDLISLAPGGFLLYLITALILSLSQLRANHPREASRLTYTLYRAHILYVGGASITAAAALVLLALASPSSGLALCVPPLYIFLISVFGTRGFRNYMLARALEGKDGAKSKSGRGSPVVYPSASPIISPANEARYGYTYADTQRPSPSPADTISPDASPQLPSTVPTSSATRHHHHTTGSTAPLLNVAGNTKLSPNPYTTFPSPPASYDGHAGGPLSPSTPRISPSPSRSALNTPSPSGSPQSFTPLRRAMVRQQDPTNLKSGWSDL
ncbi:hypothetical protein HMN09_00567400 [Mycena chlorophos]|uniref:Uncharacterized protein n=1 Tax=Mycena chlorophos TaxID=658473 RepID=A0A8H6WCX9_MYCCL|nr:hypothetical protein HMN09_00567400 [Mycena chlorophos]